MNPSCDIFCAVVDNYGDAGVCWRLARQLAREYGWTVRLWIDDPAPLLRLAPAAGWTSGDAIDGVTVVHWRRDFPPTAPAQIVVEAFACELPPAYLAAMAAAAKPPVWINLEYLSAEDWVAGCHGQASPHPRLGLTKHFFFPGFVAGTGGLIRERDADFSPGPPHAALSVSLFCYANPALPALLDAWRDGDEPIHCRVADGLPRAQVARWLASDFPPGASAQRGALRLSALPFVAQPAYDRLLAECDLNFVRGEDSFVRAQWAAHPFVWHIYPQADDAHRAKLDAFLARYVEALAPESGEALQAFWRAWNGAGDTAASWPAFRRALPALAAHAASWPQALANIGHLAENLAAFCLKRL